MTKPISATLTKLSLLLLLFLAACAGGQADTGGDQQGGLQEPPTEEPTAEPPSLCSNEYYPVVEGASWTYNVTGAPTGDYTFTDTITEVRADGFTLTSSFPDGLTRTQEWSCTSEGLVSLDFGGGAAAGLTGSGIDAVFTTSDVTGVTLPADLAVGSTWQQSLSIQGDMNVSEGVTGSAEGDVDFDAAAAAIESATTPAGTFDALRIDFDLVFNITATVEDFTIPVTMTGVTTSWYAAGIGWVKSVSTTDFMGTSVETTIELQSYTIP
jgi:hypothetical protein